MTNTQATHWVQPTGDYDIDAVLKKLNALEKSKNGKISEDKLVEVLKTLFDRPAFRDPREENWKYFLYPLCRTRMLLSHYKNEFSDYDDKFIIGEAVQIMRDLELTASKTFIRVSLTELIANNINDAVAFRNRLNDRTDHDKDVLQKIRTDAMIELFDLLVPINLANPHKVRNT